MRERALLILLFAAGCLGLPLLGLRGAAAPTEETQIVLLEQAPVVEQTPEDSGQLPTVSRRRDYFDILNLTTGRVDRVPAEDYVAGAIAAEMPYQFELEALKAQGVAAYSFALANADAQEENPDPALKGADFAADPEHMQGYATRESSREFLGSHYDAAWEKIDQAAEEISGLVLTWEEEPIFAAYHAISCGMTEDASHIWGGGLPYLTPVNSSWDRLADGYLEEADFSPRQVEEILTEAYPQLQLEGAEEDWFTQAQYCASGYLESIRAGEVEIPGTQLRELFGLRSSAAEVRYESGTFRFLTKGYGHGAGLSQCGADYMASQGAGCQEILAHYYPGAVLAREE